MIINIEGKNLAFGMRWKVLVSGGSAHKEARDAKSSLMWNDGRSINLGLLSEEDNVVKQKQPIYAGAIALARAYPEEPNILFVSPLPESEGYLVCGIRQGRPRPNFDVVNIDELEVNRLLGDFISICGGDTFLLLGDAPLTGINDFSLTQLGNAADHRSQLKKVSGFIAINPIKLLAVVAVLSAVVIGGRTYIEHRKLEKQRAAALAKKSAQDLYVESIAVKRTLPVVMASDMNSWLRWTRGIPVSIGGWKFTVATCNVTDSKKVACQLDYERGTSVAATNRTFLERAPKYFDGIDFDRSGKLIHATTTIPEAKFSLTGDAINSAKKQREEVIEFGSILQSLTDFGDQKLLNFDPFGVPDGVTADQLTQMPVLAAKWEFRSPMLGLEALEKFPKYVTVNQLVLTANSSPEYEYNKSLAKIVLTGTVFSN